MDYDNKDVLLEQLKKGEEKAFIYLVEHYSKRLFAYAYTLTNDQGLAQDVLQNFFLRTWEKHKKLNITTSLQNYLFKSIHNEFLNQYRKNKSTIVVEKKYFDTLIKIAETYDENSFTKVIDRIGKEIQNLPPKCREVFLLSRQDGLTNIEISEYLNVSIKTVEAHVTKAFSILRMRLGDKVDTILFLAFGKTLYESAVRNQ
ncbi:MAG: sigma-70 family RNA polymerase sigma factor [Flavobacteriaceae bacterium]